MARVFCEGSGDAALDPPGLHSLAFGTPSIASAHIPHGQGERAECPWCFQLVYINLDGNFRRHYEPMTKHKHRWELDMLDVYYDEPEEDGGRVPEPLRSLLHLTIGGDRIVVHCKTGSHVGVWMGDVDSDNWQPAHEPRWTIPISQYDRAVELADTPPTPPKTASVPE